MWGKTTAFIPCGGFRGERKLCRAHTGCSYTMSSASGHRVCYHLLAPSHRGSHELTTHCPSLSLPLMRLPDRWWNQPTSQHSLPATTHVDFEHCMPEEQQNLPSCSHLTHWHGIGCSWLHLDSTAWTAVVLGALGSHCLTSCALVGCGS